MLENTRRADRATARLSAFGSLHETELSGLSRLAGAERRLERKETVWREGERLPSLFILLDGWMASTTLACNKRQFMVKVHLPGDVIGLPSLAFKAAAETTIALTAVTLRPLPLHSLGRLFEAQPRIAAMMFLVSQQERMNLTDRLVSNASKSIEARLAALVIQLCERVERSYPDTGDGFHLPLTRHDLADMVGITVTRLTDALKQLRAAEVLGWSHGLLTIIDREALKAIANLPSRQLAQDALWFPTSGNDE
ncbi:Crp/Fnr family transcriptional regulator [Sphingomonas endolithica]|uniref:Crp/Fnr family transcriptional regulator n=1 Tax=Sphingomonas endolithica TaxID=2972485 RepID=UPI0021AFDBB1|nr:Crp/Fnr family transcriptional regulator [Sphingomonas sp. ZFBP2030]